MASNGQADNWTRLGSMFVAAALLHVLLLLVVLPTRPDADRASIELRWVKLEQPAAPDPTTEMTETTPPVEDEPREPEPTRQPIVPSAPAAVTSTPPRAIAEPEEQAPIAPSAQRLRELALIAGRAQSERTPLPPLGLESFAVPRLPSESGWLNDWVGTVTPRAARWLEPDGAGAARAVTASGQVFCGRARAPSAAEEFSPWMSAVVMTWRPCGRARPEAIDPTSPWIPGPGKRRD